MDVYLNGRIMPPQQAHISVEDAGLLHGVGLFETMQAFEGRVFRLQAHLDRLAESARTLGLAPTMNTQPLAEAIGALLAHNQLTNARIRLTVTAGTISLLQGQPAQAAPTVLITMSQPTVYDPAYFEQGITALIAPPAANPLDPMAGHKTLSYWGRLRTLRQAASVGAGEAIWLNVSNHLAGGAISNIFLAKDDRLLTPLARGEEVQGALPAPVLPGTTRAAVIELAKAMNIPVQRQMLSIHDLLEADEVFLTNSSWLLLPVTKVEKKTIGSGQVGPLSRALREKLLTAIQQPD